jgi:Pregnancy-associated plasma protein-A/GEVED domain/Secretion system C-terminal sorting domain
MKFLKLTLVLPAIFFGMFCFSQSVCGFDDMHRKKMKEDTVYRNNVIDNEVRIKTYIAQHRTELLSPSSVNAVLYTIPVVVHVIHTGGAIGTIYNPSNAQITGAINYLNQVYNGTYPGIQGAGDLQVQFVLASRDPNCNASTGIDRINGSSLTNYVSNGVNSSTSGGVSDLALKNFDRWDPANYYNIWVVNKIDTKDGTSGQFIAGYAYFAGAPASLDGTVMLATQMVSGQKTLPHEIGHALNLFHPFEGSPDAATCPANADCTADGDKVCDTDPITFNQTAGVVDFTCRAGTNACTGTAYTINTESNYMNYTSCYTLFTAGQKARMLAAMSLPGRASLANSWALPGAYPISPYVAPGIASCTPVTSAAGLSSYFAGIMNVTVANKSFPSGASLDDAGYIDKTGQCLYLVPMQIGNTYTFTASLLSANNEQLRVWIDYNNNGVFNNATEQIYYNANIPDPGSGYATVSGSFTIPAGAVTNAVLRMRVMDEVSTIYGAGFTITGACYNPTYGQAEDYPVYLSSALPVKLEYFKGYKKSNDVLLSWKTSFEQDIKEFQVEKSGDGSVFNKIGTVTAANIINGTTYSFTDNNVTASANYYRLRQIDKDDKNELSKVVIIRSVVDNSSVTLNVINNPFSDQLNIVFNGISATNSNISLFDVTGRKLYEKNFKVIDGQRVNINLSGLSLKQGMYILQAETEDKVITKKIIKQ